MANILPTQVWANYSYDADDEMLQIPRGSLPALVGNEAEENTGDGREVLRALVDAAEASINALAVANRPTRLTITKGTPTGISPEIVRQTYTLSFDYQVQPNSLALATE